MNLDEALAELRAEVVREIDAERRQAEEDVAAEVTKIIASWQDCVAAAESRYPLFVGQFPEHPPADFGMKTVRVYLKVERFGRWKQPIDVDISKEWPVLCVEVALNNGEWVAEDILTHGPGGTRRWVCRDEDDVRAAIKHALKEHDSTLLYL